MAPLLLALRFVLELTLLGTLAWLGFRNFDNVGGATFVAVVVVVLVGVLWGLLLSPRRRIDLPLGARVVIELALFGIASGGLASAGLPLAGIALFTLEVVVVSGLAGLGYPPGSDVGGVSDSGSTEG